MGIDRIGRLNDLLNIQDVYTVNPPYILLDKLVLTDTFTPDHYTMFSDVQTLVESYSVHVNTSRVLIDTLTINELYTGYTTHPNTIQNPIPPVNNPGEPTQPTPVDLGPGPGPFTMGVNRYDVQTVTFTSPKNSIVMKAPDFGDKQTDEPTIISEDTTNLYLIQFRDTNIWHDFRLFDLSWSQLDESENDAIRFFLRVSCGQPITYTDIYGNEHVGVIPDPDQASTSSAQGFSIKFTFVEGSLA